MLFNPRLLKTFGTVRRDETYITYVPYDLPISVIRLWKCWIAIKSRMLDYRSNGFRSVSNDDLVRFLEILYKV